MPLCLTCALCLVPCAIQRDEPPVHVLCCLQMVESASKGAILMYSKEAILKVLSTGDINPGMCRMPRRAQQEVA